jgi:hypothetical protein
MDSISRILRPKVQTKKTQNAFPQITADAICSIINDPFSKGKDWPKPMLCGMAQRSSNWMERIKGIGNCQVPIVAATAFYLLSQGIIEWNSI